MRFEVVSSGEHGFAFDVHEGDETLIRGKNRATRAGVLKVYERLCAPGQPELAFVVKRSQRKGKDAGYDIIFKLHLTSDPDDDIAWGGPFPDKATCKAAIARIRSAHFTLEGDLVDKPAKTRTEPLATNRKQLLSLIAERTGIPPADVGVVLTELAQEIARTLAADGKVTLTELGTFTRVDGKPTFKPSSAFTKQLG